MFGNNCDINVNKLKNIDPTLMQFKDNFREKVPNFSSEEICISGQSI